MDETFITLSINKFLNENNYQVIQCIPPGGQGGINFTVKNKIIYPDIICMKNDIFFIGENKPLFDELDETKLCNLSLENNLYLKAQKIVDNFFKSEKKNTLKISDIKFFLGFSIKSKKISNKLLNMLVDYNGLVILKN